MIRDLPEDFPSVRRAVIDTARLVSELQERVTQDEARHNVLADRVVVLTARLRKLEQVPKKKRRWWQL